MGLGVLCFISLLMYWFFRVAKEKRMRLWRSYQPSNQLSADKKNFTAKVIEIVMGDALVIQKESGEEMKIWLSSVRPPR